MKKQKTSKDIETKKTEELQEIEEKKKVEKDDKKHVTVKEFFEYLLAGYLAVLPLFLILIGLLLALLLIFLSL